MKKRLVGIVLAVVFLLATAAPALAAGGQTSPVAPAQFGKASNAQHLKNRAAHRARGLGNWAPGAPGWWEEMKK